MGAPSGGSFTPITPVSAAAPLPSSTNSTSSTLGVVLGVVLPVGASIIEATSTHTKLGRIFFAETGEFSESTHRKDQLCLSCGEILPTPKPPTMHNHCMKRCKNICSQDKAFYDLYYNKLKKAKTQELISDSVTETEVPSTPSNGTTVLIDLTNSRASTAAPDGSGTLHPFVARAMTSTDINDACNELALWFATGAIPFSAIENIHAKKAFELLRPTFPLPNRKDIGGKWLDVIYAKTELAIVTKISKETNICLLMDGWTERRGRSIFGVVLQFQNGEELLIDSFEASAERHTARLSQTSYIITPKTSLA